MATVGVSEESLKVSMDIYIVQEVHAVKHLKVAVF